MSDSLSERIHTGFNAVFAMLAEASPNGLVRRHGGVVVSVTRSPVPFFNTLFVMDPDAIMEDFQSAVATLVDTGLPSTTRLRRGIDDRFARCAETADLEMNSAATPGMFLLPVQDHYTYPADLEIRSGRLVFDDHTEMVAAGFGTPQKQVHDLWRPSWLYHPEATFYTGYVQGRAVASSLGFIADAAVHIFNVSILPGYRRRGYGAAMTMRAAIDGFAAGCDVAFLEASSMGLPVYKRLGFTTIVEYNYWVTNGRQPQ